MSRRTVASTVVLVGLLAVLLGIGYARGFHLYFTAGPAKLEPPYTTEEAWIVDEIVRDITEMSLGASAIPTVAAGPEAGIYVVTAGAGRAPVTVDLREDLWSPTGFAGLASDALGSGDAAVDASPLHVHAPLLDLTAPALVDASATVSQALQRSMRQAGPHESAALVVGAFGLREPFGRAADTRWALNRMTAHLAMAAALRGTTAPGVDGQLAAIVLQTLENHQARALAALDGLPADPTNPALAAWTRALRLRITDDWRLLDDPRAATRLEQREYFRARRAVIRGLTGPAELEVLGRPMEADWFRLITGSVTYVEDASLVTRALEMERAELDDVYMRLHGRPLVGEETTALNAPAGRAVTPQGVAVLSWGAWAEFGQRRLSAVISRYDSYLRHSVGNGNAADTAKAKLKEDLGYLWAFPSATLWWTKGPRGLEADARYLNEIIQEAVTRPHRLTATGWAFAAFGSKYEPVRRAMPTPDTWFFATAPRTAYDAGIRVDAGAMRPVEDYERVMAEAPYDYALAAQYLKGKYGEKVPFDEVERLVGNRLGYDTRPVAWALAALPDDDERRVGLLESACGYSAQQCQVLGAELARRGRDAQAARAYERALDDPALDDVAKANWSGWLVQHYAATGRVAPALKLAEASASTGAAVGMTTAARLYEQLGRFEDAETRFEDVASSYEQPAELIGFYYRSAKARRNPEAEAALARELERVFPEGLRNDPLPAGPPARGVFVEQDSVPARALGLQAGDVIVAVDGWQVQNMAQYRAVRAFPTAGGFVLTVARGTSRHDVRIANRLFVPDFRIANYPVQGWIEK